MPFPFARFAVALLFVVAGIVCWTAARVADDLAVQHQRMATLQPFATPASNGVRAAIERVVTANTGTGATSADYWAGRYDAVVTADTSNESDAAQLLVAANAVFRKAQREAGSRPPSVERLDQTLQAYAGVLKNGGFDPDAAYNYEYVARLRDRVARPATAGPRPGQPPTAAPPRVMPGDDLPAGPTIHGRRGTHPSKTRGEDFEVLTPMDYGEREAQPEPTPGRPLPRKG